MLGKGGPMGMYYPEYRVHVRVHKRPTYDSAVNLGFNVTGTFDPNEN